MAISALDTLFSDCQAYFQAKGRTEVLAWGRRALTHQTNQQPGADRAGRVTFVPGDDSGKAGVLTPPKEVGGNQFAIFGWGELCTVHVWGRDSTAPSDERAHYRVTFTLFERILRAMRTSQCGRIELGNPKWTVTPVELVFGAELVFELTVHGRIQESGAALVNDATPGIDSAMQFPNGDVYVPPVV
jgi:hypothetical protein